MVARGRAPFAFQAGRDFERLDNDRAIATLLSQMEKPAIQGRPPGPCVERLDPARRPAAGDRDRLPLAAGEMG
jgi:hypothetical protein